MGHNLAIVGRGLRSMSALPLVYLLFVLVV